MRGDLVSLVEPADQLRAPAQKADGVVAAKRQPVERVGVAARAMRRVHGFPSGEAVAVPGAAEGLDGAVFGFQPLAEPGLGGRAIALLHAALVPHVVAQGRGVVAIALHQRGQELLGPAADIFIIQTEGGAAGGAAGIDGGEGFGTVGRDVAGLRILVPHPFGRAGGDEFGDDHLDVVLGFEFHHAVVVAPIVLARRSLDGGPHEPVTEDVDTQLRRGLVVAFPVLFGRARFAEIDRAKRERGIGPRRLLGVEAHHQHRASETDSCHGSPMPHTFPRTWNPARTVGQVGRGTPWVQRVGNPPSAG